MIPSGSKLEFLRLSGTGLHSIEGISRARPLRALHITNNEIKSKHDPELKHKSNAMNLLDGNGGKSTSVSDRAYNAFRRSEARQTGMKKGVLISCPRFVLKIPLRARPSVFVIVNMLFFPR